MATSTPEPAGAPWCARFPTSTSIEDLAQPFRGRVEAFLFALREAGAKVTIAATYRPPQRAYLMHFCCLVEGYRDRQKIHHQIEAADVPPMAGVAIDWTCGGDRDAAIAAAAAMRIGYEIVYPAALISNHTRRLAIDMRIAFKGTIKVQNPVGQLVSASCQEDLWPIGAGFGVLKLPTDPPHWSVDGH